MYAKCLTLLLFGLVCGAWGEALPATQDAKSGDLATSETSAKLFNLGSLFGQGTGYPNYGYNYPSYGYNNYNTGYYNRPSTGYYPNTGYYYPNTNYYGSTGGSYYPSTSSGYYPSTGSGYYPTTNILGTAGYGGYGGYGGNGGLRQYSGYWQPDYTGQRNRGYGYYRQTDRYGLPPGQWA
ncbi:prisilkin-39 isoform X1 [Drosophila nasuta]|uniref:prisilkin-39 isoform X1 n=1 Tax=Drosophila nasuta TaxID=42062 RepID=UPI00295ED25C|nr:prisilkin-39 isoform X1 [Drosophila nasuta]